MFLVIGTDMESNTPCCKGGYVTLELAQNRLGELMMEDDDIDNYVIQEVKEGIDYNQPKTFILVSVEDEKENFIKDKLEKVEEDQKDISESIEQVEKRLEKMKQDWLQKQVEMHEMKCILQKSKDSDLDL